MKDITARIIAAINDFTDHHISGIDWTHRPTPEKWSAIEILGHLTDSAVVNLQRFIRCTYESDFKLVYAQNEWVAAQHYIDADPTELITLWKLLNSQIIRTLESYPADSWQAKCNGNTVEFLANDYVNHMVHHLNQITLLKHSISNL